MFHIVIHCRPKKGNEEYYKKVLGAYASILIDFNDYDGVILLSKYYVEENGWEIIDIEDEYYTFDKKSDLPEEYHSYFKEVVEYGYSVIFNTYGDSLSL